MPEEQSHPYSETHAVDTPEQTRLEFAVAGIGTRFLALATDTLIQIAAAIVIAFLFLIPGVAGVLRMLPQGALWQTAILIFVMFALYYGYFAAFEIFWNGQTPGKRVAGIRVVKDSGRPLTPSETIGRNLMRVVDQLPGFYAVAVIAALLNAQNKRLGDLIAGSLVVRERSLAEVRPIWHTSQSATQTAAPVLGAAGLSAEELAIIDAFLHRRHDLSGDVRARMAGEILRRIEPKLSMRPQRGASAESILEAVAVERRSTGGYA